MALRDRRTNIFFELGCVVALGSLDIWVSSICFKKSNISWPQQPPTRKGIIYQWKMEFWWSIPQKGAGIGHLSARDDPSIRISKMSCWILVPFLSEAAEASRYYFFENWWKKLKCPKLLKPLGILIWKKYWSVYPFEPFSFIHFTLIHPESGDFLHKITVR